MSLLTPSQSVSHKRFHQCVNHKKKLRHPLPTFCSFSFFMVKNIQVAVYNGPCMYTPVQILSGLDLLTKLAELSEQGCKIS